MKGVSAQMTADRGQWKKNTCCEDEKMIKTLILSMLHADAFPQIKSTRPTAAS